MKSTSSQPACKRPVNLTLNKDLVTKARSLTDNLSAVVETLLTEYVEHERQQRMAKTRTIEATVALWNDFNVRQGSFADEYSTL